MRCCWRTHSGGEPLLCLDVYLACKDLEAGSAAGVNCPTEQNCSAHFAMIFTTFVLMQLVNQVNARKVRRLHLLLNMFPLVLLLLVLLLSSSSSSSSSSSILHPRLLWTQQAVCCTLCV
eukprot:COSAG06_NODE_479_length_15167_cov_45.027940_2_plen_119_part_00